MRAQANASASNGLAGARVRSTQVEQIDTSHHRNDGAKIESRADGAQSGLFKYLSVQLKWANIEPSPSVLNWGCGSPVRFQTLVCVCNIDTRRFDLVAISGTGALASNRFQAKCVLVAGRRIMGCACGQVTAREVERTLNVVPSVFTRSVSGNGVHHQSCYSLLNAPHPHERRWTKFGEATDHIIVWFIVGANLIWMHLKAIHRIATIKSLAA